MDFNLRIVGFLMFLILSVFGVMNTRHKKSEIQVFVVIINFLIWNPYKFCVICTECFLCLNSE